MAVLLFVKPPAPTGIPVASTPKIIVSNVTGNMYGVLYNGAGSYSRGGYYSGSGAGSAEESIYYSLDTDHNAKIVFNTPNSSAPYWYVGFNNDNESVYAVNPSTNGSFIPTSGWSAGISITAHPDISVNTEHLLLKFGTPNDARNGIYYRGWNDASAWTNPYYSNYYSLVSPGFYYGAAQTWTFWNGDQSEPNTPSNPSTNLNFIPANGWSENLTVTPVTFMNTGTTSLITARGGPNFTAPPGAQFPKQTNNYFGDYGDEKIVWSGTRWEIRGDNSTLHYIHAAPNQTIDKIPAIGVWYTPVYSRFDTLYFEGT